MPNFQPSPIAPPPKISPPNRSSRPSPPGAQTTSASSISIHPHLHPKDAPPLTSHLRQRLLLLGLALLPVVLVALALAHAAVDIPLLDDYNAILAFALRWFGQPSPHHRLILLLSAQDGDYKLLFEHAILALQLSLFHRLSLPLLLILGNLFLLPIGWICWRFSFVDEPDPNRRLLLFLPVSYLLFQLNYAETLDWTMAALQNLPVVAFSLVSIHLLTRRARAAAFPAACLAAACACLSSANGFLLAPVGFLMLLPRRNLARLLLWLSPFPAVLLLYLFRYHRLPAAGPHPGLAHHLLFLLSFCGSAFENMSNRPVPHLAILLGLVPCLLFAHAAVTRYDRQNPTLFFTTLWILLTAALVAVGRSPLGLAQSLSVRYKLYCDLLLIFCYVYGCSRIRQSSISPARQRRIYVITLVATLALSFTSDALGDRFLGKRRARLLAGAQQYLADPTHSTPLINPNNPASTDMRESQEAARVILTDAIRTGIYTLPNPQRQPAAR